MTECQKLHLLLAGYLADELAPDDRARVANHVGACAGCAARVNAFAQLERTLFAAAEPRFQLPPTLDRRLEGAVREEIQRSRSRSGFSLRRAFRMQHILVGAPTVAAVVALVVFMLHDPPPAEVLASTIVAMQKCKTIHASGYSTGSTMDDWEIRKVKGGQRGYRRSLHQVPCEIWQTNRGKCWCHVGDELVAINGKKIAMRFPTSNWATSRFTLDSSHGLTKGIIGALLERVLKAVQSGAKIKMERHRGLLTITVQEPIKPNINNYVIKLSRGTKRLLSVRTSWLQLDSFEYDQPVPPEVEAEIERMTNDPAKVRLRQP